MRVISKTCKEPYDNVSWYSEDDIVWRRTPKEIEVPKYLAELCQTRKRMTKEPVEKHGWVIVAGVATPIYLVKRLGNIDGTYYKYPNLQELELTVIPPSPMYLLLWDTGSWGMRLSRTQTLIEDVEFGLKSTIWSVIDPIFTAQEIYRFLANKAVVDEVTQVSNDVRIQQHGFDLKTSFRGKNK